MGLPVPDDCMTFPAANGVELYCRGDESYRVFWTEGAPETPEEAVACALLGSPATCVLDATPEAAWTTRAWRADGDETLMLQGRAAPGSAVAQACADLVATQ